MCTCSYYNLMSEISDTLNISMNQSLIALLTDFGFSDPYVGIMKAVISGITPDTHLIDLTHQVPPGDIQRGAFTLWQSALDLPEGTIFLAVVDPGVGTDRRAIILKCNDQYFIGPDNGLFSYLLYGRQSQAWELTNPTYQLSSPSSTFHGRDIFAPAAAYAAQGIRGDKFGNPVEFLVELPEPKLLISDTSLSGEVLSEDQFGNLFTSLGHFRITTSGELSLKSWISQIKCKIEHQERVQLYANNQGFPMVKTFAEVPEGTCAAVIGSTGLLEIVCNQGSAAQISGLKRGDTVHLSW